MITQPHHGDVDAKDTCFPGCDKHALLEIHRAKAFKAPKVMLKFHIRSFWESSQVVCRVHVTTHRRGQGQARHARKPSRNCLALRLRPIKTSAFVRESSGFQGRPGLPSSIMWTP